MFESYLLLPSSLAEGQSPVNNLSNKNNHSSTDITVALNALNTVILSLMPHSSHKVFGKLVYQLLQVKKYLMTVGENENELRSQIAELNKTITAVFAVVDAMPDDALAKELKAKLKQLKQT